MTGRQLRAARQRLRMTSEAFSALLGISRQTYWRWAIDGVPKLKAAGVREAIARQTQQGGAAGARPVG